MNRPIFIIIYVFILLGITVFLLQTFSLAAVKDLNPLPKDVGQQTNVKLNETEQGAVSFKVLKKKKLSLTKVSTPVEAYDLGKKYLSYPQRNYVQSMYEQTQNELIYQKLRKNINTYMSHGIWICALICLLGFVVSVYLCDKSQRFLLFLTASKSFFVSALLALSIEAFLYNFISASHPLIPSSMGVVAFSFPFTLVAVVMYFLADVFGVSLKSNG